MEDWSGKGSAIGTIRAGMEQHCNNIVACWIDSEKSSGVGWWPSSSGSSTSARGCMVPGDPGHSRDQSYGRSSSAMGVRVDKWLGAHSTGCKMPDGPGGVDGAGAEAVALRLRSKTMPVGLDNVSVLCSILDFLGDGAAGSLCDFSPNLVRFREATLHLEVVPLGKPPLCS